MRNLITADLFEMSRILKKMNLRKEIESLAADTSKMSAADKKKAEQKLEIDFAVLLVENIGNAEQEIYTFLGNVSGKKLDEIKAQPLNDTLGMVKELFQQEGFKNFFSTAAESTVKKTST